MQTISIIGAGLSGTLLAFNLLQKDCKYPVKIRIIERGHSGSLGPAYSTNEDYLLNVPVEIMGCTSQEPAHFLKWVSEKKIKANAGDYMPRKLYRQYIHTMLNKALRQKDKNTHFERIEDEILDIDIEDGRGWKLVSDKNNFYTDILVLALGNSAPKHPRIKNQSFLNNPRYIRNPWHPDIFKNLNKDDHILFIGSGQTMVDLATGLYKKNYTGKMTSISRRGILPLAQKKLDPYPNFFDELEGQTKLLPVFRIIRKHLDAARSSGLDIRCVIDSLRPHTTKVWMQLPAEEKKRFLRHVFRYWEIIRSRIPPESDMMINEMRSSGQLNIIAGNVIDFIQDKDTINMLYRVRGSLDKKMLPVDLAVNCMGPDQDYETIDAPLIKNLVRKKLIHCDPAHLGINALPDGSVICADGKPSNTLFTIGLPLKGIVWEALAAPEIRVQAENLAAKLLSYN